MVEYTCVDGYYLSGDAVSECTEDQSWRRGAMVCQSTSSIVPPSRTFQIQTQTPNWFPSCSRLHMWLSSAWQWSGSHAYQGNL